MKQLMGLLKKMCVAGMISMTSVFDNNLCLISILCLNKIINAGIKLTSVSGNDADISNCNKFSNCVYATC